MAKRRFDRSAFLLRHTSTLDTMSRSLAPILSPVNPRKQRPDAEVSKATRKVRMLRSLSCDDSFERLARSAGAERIAGSDEVGRGALFGPVVAAAVILPPDCHASTLQAAGLRDSKQLTPEERERLAEAVRGCAVAITIAEVDAWTIDRVNIYQATKLAMRQAAEALLPAADHLLIDAMRLPVTCPQTSIIYGDSRSLSIAAASVIAKVHRDARMRALHREFPQYGLDEHKGYATPEHERALLRYGPCALHRRSFRPVREAGLPWDC